MARDEIRPETQKMVQGDPHPIAKYRVIGPRSNSPEFAEAFHCKKDSAWCVRRRSDVRSGRERFTRTALHGSDAEL